MKRILLILLLGLFFVRGFSQPTIITPTFPNSVGLFDLFEVSFRLGKQYSNPYNPDTISVYAMFYGPMGIFQRVDAFYYEGYIFQQLGGYEQATPVGFNKGWRIRFTPIQTGSWSFKIIAQDHSGSISQMPSDGLSYLSFQFPSVVRNLQQNTI